MPQLNAFLGMCTQGAYRVCYLRLHVFSITVDSFHIYRFSLYSYKYIKPQSISDHKDVSA